MLNFPKLHGAYILDPVQTSLAHECLLRTGAQRCKHRILTVSTGQESPEFSQNSLASSQESAFRGEKEDALIRGEILEGLTGNRHFPPSWMEIKGKRCCSNRLEAGTAIALFRNTLFYLCLISNRLFLEEPTVLSTAKPKNTSF